VIQYRPQERVGRVRVPLLWSSFTSSTSVASFAKSKSSTPALAVTAAAIPRSM
jgi:hypothetical protein